MLGLILIAAKTPPPGDVDSVPGNNRFALHWATNYPINHALSKIQAAKARRKPFGSMPSFHLAPLHEIPVVICTTIMIYLPAFSVEG